METAFGYDFSGVRVHVDDAAAASAAAVDAVAYTVGHHVAFAHGAYAPGSPGGDRVLAHELAHVVQQTAVRPSPVPAVPTTAADAAGEREAVAAATALSASTKPGLTARPVMLARQPASSSPDTSTTTQLPGPARPTSTRSEPAPVPGPSRGLEAEFLRVLEDEAASRRLPQRVTFVSVVSSNPDYELLRILEWRQVVPPPGQLAETKSAFWAAWEKFVPQQAKAIEQELIKDAAQGPAEWEVVLKEFQNRPEMLNEKPFAGMKDRVEDALLKRSAARAEKAGRKPPPGHEPAVPTLLHAFQRMEQQLLDVYSEGTKAWEIPPEVSLDALADEVNAGAAAAGLGSALTALPGMGVGGMAATAGVGLAFETLGVSLIVAGTIAAIDVLIRQHAANKEVAESQRRKYLQDAIGKEMVQGVWKAVGRYREHEALFVSELVTVASSEKISLDNPIPVWETFVWSHIMPGFPKGLEQGRDWVANTMRNEFNARLRK